MRIRYNSPVVLTFALTASGVLLVDQLSGFQIISRFFTVRGSFDFSKVLDYIRLFSHVLGHAGWNHLMGNCSFLLLIGPILEEKYGSLAILEMILFTAAATGILNAFLFSTGLLGASGIVFMMIFLGSFTNIRSGEIPLTFVLVAILYLTKEVLGIFEQDQISQFAHILGGIAGAIFGGVYCPGNRSCGLNQRN